MITSAVLATLVAFSATPPVQMASCDVLTPSVVPNGSDAGTMTVGGYAVRVRFTDRAAQTAKRVTFLLDDGTPVTDVGSFSTGASIDHQLDVASTQAATCSVAAVTFADGQTWSAK